MKRKNITAGELLDELEKDPKYIDRQIVTINVGENNVQRLREILTQLDLTDVADLEETGIIAGYCRLRLLKEDRRIQLFINKMKEEKWDEHLSIRADRVYSKLELDKAEWLRLRIRTVGAENPKEGQRYDRKNACLQCGAGTVPIEPLYIPRNRMGKKKIDHTAHQGLLLLNRSLAEEINKVGLSGIIFHEAIVGREKKRYVWGKIKNTFPKLSTKSVIEKENPCSMCGRSGYFDTYSEITEFWYDEKDIRNSHLNDFNVTWEYFGVWKHSKLGGAQVTIVSQKARQFFLKEKVKFIDFEPIFILKYEKKKYYSR